MLIIPLFLFMSCPPEKNELIELEIYETYCTSIELKITMMDSLKEKEYSVKRNDSLIATRTMTDNQTIITDENLEPNTQYTYKAYSKNDESEIVTATTMDTTSHDFTWEEVKLGNGRSLYDVKIINEDDIWVVGKIRTDSINYNAAHWNGEKWELKRIYPPPFLFANITAIFTIDDEIWTAGTAPMRKKNGVWAAFSDFPTTGWINSIWGTSSSNMYFVGSNGSIVHYDGNEFVKMESGTNVNLRVINGEEDAILVTGFNWTTPSTNILLSYKNGTWETLLEMDHANTSDENPYGRLQSLDVFDGIAYVLASDYLIKYDISKNEISEHTRLDEGTFSRAITNESYHDVKVQNHNDIMLFDWNNGSTAHYNGKNWYIDDKISDHYFRRGDYNGKVAYVVGSGILIGKRNN